MPVNDDKSKCVQYNQFVVSKQSSKAKSCYVFKNQSSQNSSV